MGGLVAMRPLDARSAKPLNGAESWTKAGIDGARSGLLKSDVASGSLSGCRSAFWQTQHSLSDHIALNLRSTTGDRLGARVEKRVHPTPVLDRKGGAFNQLRVWSQDLLGETHHP